MKAKIVDEMEMAMNEWWSIIEGNSSLIEEKHLRCNVHERASFQKHSQADHKNNVLLFKTDGFLFRKIHDEGEVRVK